MTKEYIISEEKLQNVCAVLSHHGMPIGARDFGDNIRSRPYNPEQEKQAAVNAVLGDLWQICIENGVELKYGDLLSVPSKDNGWLILKLVKRIADFRQQTGQTSAEQQRGREE